MGIQTLSKGHTDTQFVELQRQIPGFVTKRTLPGSSHSRLQPSYLHPEVWSTVHLHLTRLSRVLFGPPRGDMVVHNDEEEPRGLVDTDPVNLHEVPHGVQVVRLSSPLQ